MQMTDMYNDNVAERASDEHVDRRDEATANVNQIVDEFRRAIDLDPAEHSAGSASVRHRAITEGHQRFTSSAARRRPSSNRHTSGCLPPTEGVKGSSRDRCSTHEDAPFCVYYGRALGQRRMNSTAPSGRNPPSSSTSSSVLLFSPILLQDCHFRTELSETDRSVLELELSQHALDQDDMLAAVFISNANNNLGDRHEQEETEQLNSKQQTTSVDSPMPDCIAGIPDIYLLPSSSTSDPSDAPARRSPLDPDYSALCSDHEVPHSPAFDSSSSTDLLDRDHRRSAKPNFRDTPRGEPMGSECVAIPTRPAAPQIVSNMATSMKDPFKKRFSESSSDEDKNRRRLSEDPQHTRRLWLREDVEGADNIDSNVNVPLISLTPSDDKLLEGRQGQHNVRPPLVGQSEDAPRSAVMTATSSTSVQYALLAASSRNASDPVIDEPEAGNSGVSAAQTSVIVQSRREFYSSLVDHDHDQDDENDGDEDEEEEKQTSSVESTDAEHAPPLRGSGYQSDHRASSPSVMSVASSVASSKRLEWDSGADIGYGGPKVLYGRLSTLERMAIGSFFKRTEPEGKSALGKDKTAGGLRTANDAAQLDANSQQRESSSNGRLTLTSVVAATATLEDVVLSIAEQGSTQSTSTVGDYSTADSRYLAALSDGLQPMNDEDEQDTEDEIAEYCRKKLALKERSPSPEKVKKTQTGGKYEMRATKRMKETILINVDCRSSSMTDLSRGTNSRTRQANYAKNVSGHSRSALDIAGECCGGRQRHRQILSLSPGSMVGGGSSSSSSTVVGTAVPAPSSNYTDVELGAQQTPFILRGPPPLCSTALRETPADFASRPSFGTQTLSSVRATEEVTCSDSFDQKLKQTRKLIAQLGTDPRWSTQRHRLVQELLECVDSKLSPDVVEVESLQQGSSGSGGGSSSYADLIKTTSRPEPRGGSSDNLECKSTDNATSTLGSQDEFGSAHLDERANNAVPDVDVALQENQQSVNSRSKCKSSTRTSPRSTSSSSPLSHHPIFATTTTTRSSVPSRLLSSSDKSSEATLDTIREQKRKDPQRHHHQQPTSLHNNRRFEPSKPGNYGGTLASSFEFYTMPIRYDDDDRGAGSGSPRSRGNIGLGKPPSKNSGQSSSSSAAWSSSVHWTVTNSEASRSGTPLATLPAVVTTVNSLTCTSQTSSNICLQSSSSERRTTTTTTTRNSSGQRRDENMNLEGLSVVKELVRHQRESYVRKLKREMDWLERIEAILVGNYAQKQQQRQSDRLRGKARESNSLGQPSSRRIANKSSKSSKTSQAPLSGRTKDFGQCFPTPQLSETDLSPSADEMKAFQHLYSTSVGVQTSDSMLMSSQVSLKSARNTLRPIVAIPLTAPQVRRKKTTTATMMTSSSTGTRRVNRHPPIAWFVPFVDKTCSSRRFRLASSRELAMRGRADGAHASTSSGVPVSAAVAAASTTTTSGSHAGRHLSLQEAFSLFKSDAIRHSKKRQERVKARERLRLEARPRIPLVSNKTRSFKRATKPLPISAQHHNPQRRFLSQRQMHEQTEKLYQALSEVTKRQELKQREDAYRTNRQMAEVFKKKLLEQVLRGKVSMPNTQKCT